MFVPLTNVQIESLEESIGTQTQVSSIIKILIEISSSNPLVLLDTAIKKVLEVNANKDSEATAKLFLDELIP